MNLFVKLSGARRLLTSPPPFGRGGRLRRGILAFGSRQEGAVLTEAAIVLPILIIMLDGMYEFNQAYTANRDIGDVAATTADLVSQVSTVSTANLQDIVQVSNNLMAPYPVTPLTLTIQSISEDANGKVTLAWTCTWTSISASPACTTPGTTYSSLPAGLIAPSQCLIMSQASYTFTPAMGQFLVGGVTFTSVSYFKPRVTSCVTKTS
jgi:Flp pilus assembly protein TadG